MLKKFTFLLIVFAIAAFGTDVSCQNKTDILRAKNDALGAQMTSIPMDPTIRIGMLSNGITYYIKANKKPEKRVELRMAVKAGSMQEDPDQLGIAHFVEHMAFNGSKNFSKNELVNYLESVGSRFGPDLNAYTSFDETVYMLQVRTDEPEHLEKGMLILRDWSDGISFDEDEIDKERGVVISEWRSRLSPEQRMQKEYLPFMYYQSRYAERLPIGDPEILKSVPYDAVRRYYKDWYRPDIMAVFVVGDIDVNEMEKKIIAQFGDVSKTHPIRDKVAVSFPPHDQTFARVITDAEANNTRVQVIYKHAYEKIDDLLDYRRNLVNNLYNRILGNRLTEISRNADPPYVFAYSGYSQQVGDMAAYSSVASTDPKNVRSAYRTLLEENQRVLLHGFTDTELEREKAALIRVAEQNVLEEEKMESSRLVQRLVSHFLKSTPLPDAKQILEMYKSMLPTITTTQVSENARQWLTDKNRMILITAPEKDLAILPDSAELIAMLDEVAKSKLKAYQDIDVSAPLLNGTFSEGSITHFTHDATLDIYHWQLANGVKVSAKQTNFKNDEILMNAYSPGGHSLYEDKLYPSARSASAVIGSSGVGTFNETALEKKLSAQRVSVSPFIFERFEGFNGSSSVEDLETMMQLIYSYATAFREDTIALNAYRSQGRAMFGNLLSNPLYWYSDKVARITSQNHPRRGVPKIESYDELSMDDIVRIYKDRFKDFSDMQFFFVGNFNVDSLQKLTSRYLGALPGHGRQESWKDVGERMPSGVVDSIFTRGEAPQSRVQLIYHGKDAYNPETGYVLQSLIDLARIKLRESLREEESGVYGVSIYGGQSLFPVEQYSINISFNAEPSRTQELIEKAKEVLNFLKTEIDPADIAKVTEMQRQSRIRDLQQNQFWMNSLVNSWINNTDMANEVQLQPLEARIGKLDKETLLNAARKYLNDTEVISVVMYPGKA